MCFQGGGNNLSAGADFRHHLEVFFEVEECCKCAPNKGLIVSNEKSDHGVSMVMFSSVPDESEVMVRVPPDSATRASSPPRPFPR